MWNKHVSRVFVPLIWQKLKMTYQYHRHYVIVIVHNNTVCHTEWVTIKTPYVNNIDTTQKVFHFCVNISTHSPTETQCTNFTVRITALTTYFVIISNLYMLLEETVSQYHCDTVNYTHYCSVTIMIWLVW